ncbi:MAG: sensor histidine kinase [Anaerolineales bacterium]|nr:sensor histidine kinase [Anaerolineales bacterium]
MQKSLAEPGLLQAFRFYGWLRFFLLVIILSASLVYLPLEARATISYPSIAWSLVFCLLLLGMLYWRWLESKLRKWYIPLAVTVSTAGLLLEQHFIMRQGINWQNLPFMVILVILVAWQYDFRSVLFFILGAAAAEGLLNLFLPSTVVFIGSYHPDIPLMVSLFLVGRSTIYLLFGYVVSRLVKAQRQQRQALAEANQKLVRQAAAQEQLTISRERVRISRELHDTLAHTLSALAVQTDALLSMGDALPERVTMMLERMLATTRAGLDGTRRSLKDLRAAPLDEMGLVGAVHLLAEDLAARQNIALVIKAPDELDELPPEVEHGFYRIAQEALENAALHSGADRISVKLSARDRVICLEVADNGTGFSTETVPVQNGGRLGIQGMRERAELIDAILEISSQDGRGTLVKAIWTEAR